MTGRGKYSRPRAAPPALRPTDAAAQWSWVPQTAGERGGLLLSRRHLFLGLVLGWGGELRGRLIGLQLGLECAAPRAEHSKRARATTCRRAFHTPPGATWGHWGGMGRVSGRSGAFMETNNSSPHNHNQPGGSCLGFGKKPPYVLSGLVRVVKAFAATRLAGLAPERVWRSAPWFSCPGKEKRSASLRPTRAAAWGF